MQYNHISVIGDNEYNTEVLHDLLWGGGGGGGGGTGGAGRVKEIEH